MRAKVILLPGHFKVAHMVASYNSIVNVDRCLRLS